MPDYKGIDYLRNKLNFKKSRVRLRYKHYEMKNIVRDFNISTPPDLRSWMGALGWCAKAVDSIADRLVFREFDNVAQGTYEVETRLLQDPDGAESAELRRICHRT